MARWIEFVEVESPGKTQRWEVRVTTSGTTIGRIGWSSGWRRYTLLPAYPTEWEQDCLRDVAEFIERQTREYKSRAAGNGGKR